MELKICGFPSLKASHTINKSQSVSPPGHSSEAQIEKRYGPEKKKKNQKISKEAGTTVSALTYTGVTHNIW